eukprot:m.128949 g.128949  ORF g.128949 m.128949 type:complete len:71 (+) comp14568_c0_seq6:216-428(+)
MSTSTQKLSGDLVSIEISEQTDTTDQNEQLSKEKEVKESVSPSDRKSGTSKIFYYFYLFLHQVQLTNGRK